MNNKHVDIRHLRGNWETDTLNLCFWLVSPAAEQSSRFSSDSLYFLPLCFS